METGKSIQAKVKVHGKQPSEAQKRKMAEAAIRMVKSVMDKKGQVA